MSSPLWLEPCALAPLPTPPWAHREGALPLLYLIDLLNPPVDAIKGPAVCDVIYQDHTLGRQQSLVERLASTQATQAHTHNELNSHSTYFNAKHIF